MLGAKWGSQPRLKPIKSVQASPSKELEPLPYHQPESPIQALAAARRTFLIHTEVGCLALLAAISISHSLDFNNPQTSAVGIRLDVADITPGFRPDHDRSAVTEAAQALGLP